MLQDIAPDSQISVIKTRGFVDSIRLWKTLAKKIIREVKTRNKEKQQRRPNNNVVIKHSRGPSVSSQGL